MAEPIIRIEHIAKRYQLGETQPYVALRDVMTKFFQPKRWLQKPDTGGFWALEDVSFDISQGEAVGIIGRNGAGKSTLLKILSRITPPTKGKITLNGRVASLLEVGTGFHPELTGRENIFLNGAILGMTRREIRKQFDNIVQFAEVEKFLDTPVKRYSSGMYVRLAFAVAAHLEPDILLVDEVLAVGDIAFQKKCLGKMDEVIKESGRTILFVSHNMSAIQTLCSRSVLIDHGNVMAIGQTNDVVNTYLHSMMSYAAGSGPFTTEVPGFVVENIKLVTQPNYQDDLVFEMLIQTTVPKDDMTVELHIINSQLNRLMTGKVVISHVPVGTSRFRFTLQRPQLPPGNYSLDISLHTFNVGFFYRQQILFFEISPGGMDDPFVIARKDTLGSYPNTIYETLV